jgi:hypothetical protein
MVHIRLLVRYSNLVVEDLTGKDAEFLFYHGIISNDSSIFLHYLYCWLQVKKVMLFDFICIPLGPVAGFLQARFGIAIFITLCLNIIANAIETIENPTADRNIRLNEVDDGKYCAIPWIFNND